MSSRFVETTKFAITLPPQSDTLDFFMARNAVIAIMMKATELYMFGDYRWRYSSDSYDVVTPYCKISASVYCAEDATDKAVTHALIVEFTGFSEQAREFYSNAYSQILIDIRSALRTDHFLCEAENPTIHEVVQC